MHANATRQTFRWDDPLYLDGQISADERAVRDAAHAYCQEQLLPQVQEAFRHEKTNANVFREMGSRLPSGSLFANVNAGQTRASPSVIA